MQSNPDPRGPLVTVSHVERDEKGVYVFGACGHMSTWAPHVSMPQKGAQYRCYHCKQSA
jgi:hypothetical protein